MLTPCNQLKMEETKIGWFLVSRSDLCRVSFLPGQFLSLHVLVRFPVHSLPPYFAEFTMYLVCVPCPHVLLQGDHADTLQSTKDGRSKIGWCIVSRLELFRLQPLKIPGQFLSLHVLVRFPHSLPPYFAEVTIDLSIVPCPHVLLQGDHSVTMQSTKDKRKENSVVYRTTCKPYRVRHIHAL